MYDVRLSLCLAFRKFRSLSLFNATFLSLHLYFQPFADAQDNIWESLSLWFLFILTTILPLPMFAYPYGRGADTIISILILVPVVLMASRTAMQKLDGVLLYISPSMSELQNLTLTHLQFKFSAVDADCGDDKRKCIVCAPSISSTAITPQCHAKNAEARISVTRIHEFSGAKVEVIPLQVFHMSIAVLTFVVNECLLKLSSLQQEGDNVIDIYVRHRRFKKQTGKYTVVVHRQTLEDAAVEEYPWYAQLLSRVKQHRTRYRLETMRMTRLQQLRPQSAT